MANIPRTLSSNGLIGLSLDATIYMEWCIHKTQNLKTFDIFQEKENIKRAITDIHVYFLAF